MAMMISNINDGGGGTTTTSSSNTNTSNTASSTSGSDNYSSNGVEIAVGDKVQIKAGGIDVTNGVRAKAGVMYGDGGPLMAEVVLIDSNWYTAGNFGLPQRVVKVRCQAEGITVWQVQPEDIVVKISANKPVQTTPSNPTTGSSTGSGNKGSSSPYDDSSYNRTTNDISTNVTVSLNAYAIEEDSDDWEKGISTTQVTSDARPDTLRFKTLDVTNGAIFKEPRVTTGEKEGWRRPTRSERAVLGTGSLWVDEGALNNETKFSNMFSDTDKRRHLLGNDTENIQNEYGFPKQVSKGRIVGEDIKHAQYDYQIIPGESPSNATQSLEDKLQTARAALGIQVHGSNSIARTSKYYMYNRFKVPDKNLNHNKSFTHIFFTRPDLYLLDCFGNASENTAARQVLNHTEGAMLWRRNPDLFKLLTDATRCGDSNNFNLLLSQQVKSFSLIDEKLSTFEAGKNWKEYSMVYGDTYSGRAAGEFSCTFTETSDYSVYSLIKLWITYIDNVSKGAWKPSYNLFGSGVSIESPDHSHVYTKTIDYAASAYVIKTSVDSEDVLYWTQYFGIIPVNTGSGAFSVDYDKSVGETPQLDITFRYAWKLDLNPISLITFNDNARISGQQIEYESPWNDELGHVARPYVGAPFIEMKLGNPKIAPNRVVNDFDKTQIRLKFKRSTDTGYTDKDLYRSPFK